MMASRGYDMTPTMYSPDGRIYQVEYAIETVKRGTLAIGVKCSKDGVIIAVEENPRALQVLQTSLKKYSKLINTSESQLQDIFLMPRIQVDNARFFLTK